MLGQSYHTVHFPPEPNSRPLVADRGVLAGPSERAATGPISGPRRPSRPDLHLPPILRPAGVEGARPVRAVIGVGAEEVPQALEQVGGAALAPQAVVVG